MYVVLSAPIGYQDTTKDASSQLGGDTDGDEARDDAGDEAEDDAEDYNDPRSTYDGETVSLLSLVCHKIIAIAVFS